MPRIAACAALIVIAVPLTYIANLSQTPGLDGLPPIPAEPAQRKQVFFDFLRPVVRDQNAAILADRRLFVTLAADAEHGWYDRLRWRYLLGRYRVEETLDRKEQQAQLSRRIRELPESLVLAQAAKESAWGRSRFARQGNALFGERCFTEGCGILPGARAAGAIHEVEAFASIADSVESYLLNLNSHERYNDLRAERQRLIDAGQPVTGAALAPFTTAYSERREAYTREIVDLIRHNRLEHTLEQENHATDA
jgi:Bax protein